MKAKRALGIAYARAQRSRSQTTSITGVRFGPSLSASAGGSRMAKSSL